MKRARGAAVSLPGSTRLSASGGILAMATLLLFASALREFRPEIGGLSIHPFLALLIPLIPVMLTRVARIPRAVLVPAIVLVVWMNAAMLTTTFVVSESFKLIAAGVMILVTATAIKSERDFVVVVAALLTVSAAIAARGVFFGGASGDIGSLSGYNFMPEIGNKNAYSLIALPAILLGGYVVVTIKTQPLTRAFIAGGSFATTAAIFATANRSGWLGVALIAVMLVSLRFSLRTAIYVAIGVLVVYVLVEYTGIGDILDWKVNQTRNDYSSDTLRRELIVDAFQIGLSSPLFGVGPDTLPVLLARQTPTDLAIVDVHDVFGYLIGAFGVPALLTTMWLCAALWFPVRRAGSKDARLAIRLMRMMVVLWCVRGIFTREVLYAPAMCLAVGLSLGLLAIRQEQNISAAVTSRPRPGGPAPATTTTTSTTTTPPPPELSSAGAR